MSFERQICQKCHKINYCVDAYSIISSAKGDPTPKWLCEMCYGFEIEHASRKDTIRSIMIQCGIEDIEH